MAVERTARLPAPVVTTGIPFAPPARATIDTARHEDQPERLRSLLEAPVRGGLCTLHELTTELDQGNQRGSAAVRAQLRMLAHTANDELRRKARYLARRCPLPPPRWDTTISDSSGRRLGTVDAWWDDVGLGWLLTPASAAVERGNEQREELALTAAGVVLVRTTATTLYQHRDLVLAELVRAFSRAASRPRPRVFSAARCPAA